VPEKPEAIARGRAKTAHLGKTQKYTIYHRIYGLILRLDEDISLKIRTDWQDLNIETSRSEVYIQRE
jgi:hypothetical protein